MANLEYVTSNKLTIEADAQKRKSRKGVMIVGLILALGALFLHPVAAAIVMVFALISWGSQNGSQTLRAGAVGEDITMNVLSHLPDSYTIYNQVDLPNEKSRTGFNEADIIVMGPDTVFVIEVKHNNGSIYGTEGDKDWHVQKVGRGGTPYSKTMRNPIAQVKKLVWLLSDDLKKKNGRAWVQGVVVFSNQDSSVRVRHSGNVPVLNLSELNRYILSYQAKSRIVNHC
ncbi:hypothetical protein A3732_14340, partial [Oleiphilus sp. HI0050]